uniref:non-specific serine/threonine protein kinase n=1 Tax=Oryza rufipogon TaxID=4529 RepID=A0A0E0MQK8_ORYRU
MAPMLPPATCSIWNENPKHTQDINYSHDTSDDEDFFKTCSSQRCSKHGPEIRYPFRLSTQPPSCGAPGMQLSCSGQDTILDHPVLGSCKVTMIYYRHVIMNAIPLVDSLPHCPLQKLVSVNQSTAVYKPHTSEVASVVGCSRDSIDTNQYDIVGPTSCPSLANNASQFWVETRTYPSYTTLVRVSQSLQLNFFLFYPATSSVGTFIVLSLIVATALYISLKSRYNEEIHLKVEMFLKTYGTSKPTRYTFSEVKKIARRFKDKLGHGAFGTVYKGELPNGVPVAVKMLENSVGEGQEFINEVATIGRIHHANILNFSLFLLSNIICGHIYSSFINCGHCTLHLLEVKISDFGLAKLCARDQSIVTLTAARGTMGYIAPELYSRNFGAISYKSDVYSFGMLVLEMVRVSQSLQSRYNEEIHLKVEMFLKTYGTSKPTRYTFSEVKKIARRFKDKLGHGAFGTVYKGELPNGVPVAVKMLENSVGEGQEFINEVATIGRIHHANIRCSKHGPEIRYPFRLSTQPPSCGAPGMQLSCSGQDTILDHPVLGSCKVTMIYYRHVIMNAIPLVDSSPHCPLQKLMSVNQSTAVYKPHTSEVASLVGCSRDSIDTNQYSIVGPTSCLSIANNASQFWYLAYPYTYIVINGQDLVLTMETTQGEKEMVRQLAIVALWCIQWNPKDRPSMTKVVNMLMGRLQNLQVPPKPFISKFLTIYLLLAFLSHGTCSYMATTASGWDDHDFFRHCSPSWCSKDGPEIRFPHRLESSSSACGASCARLACSGQDTILHHPFLGPCKVTSIDYKEAVMNIIPLVYSSSPCPLQKLIFDNLQPYYYPRCYLYSWDPAKIVRCSKEFTPSDSGIGAYPPENAAVNIVGPISCLSGTGKYFSYLVHAQLYMYLLPLDCRIISRGSIPIPGPDYSDSGGPTFKERAERIINFAETTVSWYSDDKVTFNCTECERQKQHCAFSSQRNQTFCMSRKHHGSSVKVISATSSAAALVVLSLIVAAVLYISLKSRYDEEVHLKVEMFLRTYGTSKPTRYNFSDVKKIARRFKEQLGQGGFGSVYKGELPNGVPVAVKMIEHSTGDGEEFINEVATIGQIHHINIVRLLGFCSEGTRHILIYEFMPNESLEKYIFLHDPNTS